MRSTSHRVVIVGGGAGGLELAVRLGRRYGRDNVVLIDANPFHIWKPSLHEVAAGTLDIHREGLSYAMLAHDSGFQFLIGRVTGVDRTSRTVAIDAFADAQGDPILPARTVPYDTLVLALGSYGNFFNTPGAELHAISLDSTDSAEFFRIELLKAMARADADAQAGAPRQVNVVIVGGGATGVELAAELHEAGRRISDYGLSRDRAADALKITLIEGGPRILGPLPERVSDAARTLLVQRGIQVETSCRVLEVTQHAVRTADREFPSDLRVWAAGIKAPGLLETLGLPLTPQHMIQVDDHLVTSDPNVYALGDCAAAPWAGTDKTVPARAQAAHQQASYLFKVLSARMDQSTPVAEGFRFRDFGSLVSLGHSEGVGSLMGGLSGPNLQVEGWVARVMYASSHWTHYAAVLGIWGATMRSLARVLTRRSRPRVKLH
ncbi:NAD(P)/FAD-dependent oxidoreductase [Pigmentiphaga litoralis]|uniref:NADH dehydrogenase n=1 Tax=Pigmentiphaga litoralis TaxID=516702 RepID=A0A7Y9IXZ9_9BURK|nr:FAD-dependent oxidoreductase [Pigmentiphaga litoralis]NYE26047.1 NADH dehydrogenase [Pigmentiphaga litoralis]NYE85167.1 NADH dehydrogenase [Pigmentiphaga litoralis]